MQRASLSTAKRKLEGYIVQCRGSLPAREFGPVRFFSLWRRERWLLREKFMAATARKMLGLRENVWVIASSFFALDVARDGVSSAPVHLRCA